MSTNSVNLPQTNTYYGKEKQLPPNSPQEITTELEQCFSRLASIQRQGILCRLQQMNAALCTMSEELAYFLNTR